MLKTKGRIGLIKIIYVVVMMWVLLISISKPMHNLIPGQMLVGSIILSVLLILCFWWLDHKCNLSMKRTTWIVIVAVYAVIAYVVALLYGNHWQGLPLADYSNVYLGALDIVDGNKLENEAYFLVYGNNIKPMILLSWLIRIARLLGLGNEYLLLLVVSVIGSALALASILSLLKKDSLRVIATALFLCCIPTWFFNAIFYTDTLSFSSAIVSIALLERGSGKSESAVHKWICYILFAIVLVIGASVKITVTVPVAAYLIIRVIEKKVGLKGLLILLLLVVLVQSVLTLVYNRYPVYQKAKETENPVISWIGLGLDGDGSWSSGYEYIHHLTALSSKLEKTEYAKAYIKENFQKAFELEHIVAKTRFNYASGNFGAHGLVSEGQSGKMFREMFDSYGRFYWRTSQICFTYIMSLYLISLIAAIVGVIKRTETNRLLAVGSLAFVGMFLFLMIWEANNRQLFNQIPTMILTATLSIESLMHEKRMAK